MKIGHLPPSGCRTSQYQHPSITMNSNERTPSERRTVSVTMEGTPVTLADSEKWRARVDERKGAVVLVSGGLDSATVLALARSTGIDCHALTVDYGQRHQVELKAAERVAVQLGAASHRVVSVDLRVFGGSALTDDIAVPNPTNADSIGNTIPSTYVPARNTIFLALALGWAEVLEVNDIYIGATARDFSGYPDCRPEFLRAFEHLANLATRAGTEKRRQFHVHAPLINWTKDKIIRRGLKLGVNFAITHSCYDPSEEGLACGLCDSCILRRRGFEAAGVDDPTEYAESQ
jgi:7-cyano-7-deazaguanine synthase